MTLSVNHSAAALAETRFRLEREASAYLILNALRDLEAAQRDAEKASVYCAGNDYELAQHEAMTARIAFRQAIMNAGIDPDIIESAVK
ncbi:hypothetical protein M2336_001702 [Sphingobium sp. B1D7B]|uniref:hypothetical protein n=1 Tax=Sphingobium sp. B1D7B TaxID=2940578 RepID=UPI002224B651|nr:hypothetical protein [Sphingobium sp. B1D7B]MCW2405073.1 hypothetical protein [Sphingobium sp. B1D7B]